MDDVSYPLDRSRHAAALKDAQPKDEVRSQWPRLRRAIVILALLILALVYAASLSEQSEGQNAALYAAGQS